LVLAGLNNRDLLTTVQESWLWAFHRRRYVLPESTAYLIVQHPLTPVEELLDRSQEQRPDVWRLLTTQIKAAVNWHTQIR
jgi:hypothetical protein